MYFYLFCQTYLCTVSDKALWSTGHMVVRAINAKLLLLLLLVTGYMGNVKGYYY